ncbi:MAG: TlpA disulfide reductase family protein [Myxococcales bacterium]|nr:TlpA family protein disulfide reductase [Myxococcota bacterium]MDW8281835.1 TlpA disulfide reductase family protein [Myxococcales bacterium]
MRGLSGPGLLALLVGAAHPVQAQVADRLQAEVELRRLEASLLHRKVDLRGVLRWSGGRVVEETPSPAPVVLLHLWATTCRPCRDEFLRLSAVLAALEQEPSLGLVVAAEDDSDTLRRFLQERPWPPPPGRVLYKTIDGRLRQAVQTMKQPLTLLLDRSWVVRQAFVGSLEHRRNELVGAIEALLRSLQAPQVPRPPEPPRPAPGCSPLPEVGQALVRGPGEGVLRRLEARILHQVLDQTALPEPVVVHGTGHRDAGPSVVLYLPPGCPHCEAVEARVRQVVSCTPLSGLELRVVSGSTAPRGLTTLRPRGQRAPERGLLPWRQGPLLLLLDERATVRQALGGPLEHRRNEMVGALERLWRQMQGTGM